MTNELKESASARRGPRAIEKKLNSAHPGTTRYLNLARAITEEALHYGKEAGAHFRGEQCLKP
jgi:hypothetical protein